METAVAMFGANLFWTDDVVFYYIISILGIYHFFYFGYIS